MPSKRRRQGSAQSAFSPKALGLWGATDALGGATLVSTALPLAGDALFSQATATPIFDPPASESQIEIWRTPVAEDAPQPTQRQTPPWLAALLGPAIVMQLIWMAIFALTSLVWLQMIPSALSDGIVSWPVPAMWPKHSQSIHHVANPIHLPPASTAGVVVLTALLLAAVATFAWMVVRAQALRSDDNRVLWLILGGAVVMGLTLIFLPVMPSDDVICYIAYGRIDALYHGNALINVPIQYPHDPFLAYNYWDDIAAYYGPVWLTAASGLTLLAQLFGGSPAVYVLLYKLFSFAGFLACAALIWDILSRIAPKRRLMGTLLWAWNPLTLWEFGAGGHNDTLMLALFLGGIALMLRGREVPGLVLWGMAAAAKYTLIVLVPLYLWYLLMHGWSRADSVGGRPPLWRALSGDERPVVADRAAILRRLPGVIGRGALVAGIMIAWVIPYWHGSGTLTTLFDSPSVLRTTSSLQDTFHGWVQSGLQLFLHMGSAQAGALATTILKVLGLAGFVILWGWQLLRRAAHDLLGAWGWVILGFLLLTTGWFWPWYSSWLLIIVALRPVDRLTKAGLVLTGSVLMLYFYLQISASWMSGFRGLTAWVPMLAFLGWSWWRERRHKATMGDLDLSVTDVAEVRQGT